MGARSGEPLVGFGSSFDGPGFVPVRSVCDALRGNNDEHFINDSLKFARIV